MNKKNLRMAGLIVGGVLIWMLLDYSRLLKMNLEKTSYKDNSSNKELSATDYRLPSYQE